MQIELRPIDSIHPYENNPRLNDEAVDAVANSLREFGFRQPIVVDSEGVIIAGHTRYKAAIKLGLAKVPVHVATDLTATQVKAYRIADNATNEIAEWNYEMLPIELSALQEMDFNLGLLGFDQEELNRIMSGDVEAGLTDPDDVPLPPDDAITQPGDLWILGNQGTGFSILPHDGELGFAVEPDGSGAAHRASGPCRTEIGQDPRIQLFDPRHD